MKNNNKWYHVFLRCIRPIMFFQYESMIGGMIEGSAGIAQTVGGYVLYKKGKEAMEALVRPEFEIPEEIRQNLTQAQLLTLEGLPTEQQQKFVEDIQRTMQSSLAALKDRGTGLANVPILAQQQMDAFQILFGQNVTAQKAGQADLAQARGTMAGYKDVQFNINQMQPYIQDYLTAEAEMGAGLTNIFGGVSTIASSGQTFAGGGGGGGGMSI